MDGRQRTFTHNSVLELIDSAVKNIILYTRKWRRDRHFPLQLPKEIDEVNDHSTLTPEERYIIMERKLDDARDLLEDENLKPEEVDDRRLRKAMKNNTMGRKPLGSGRTCGLAYNLYYYRDPTRRGRSQRVQNIPSRLKLKFKQYPPVPEEQLIECLSFPAFEEPPRDQFDSDEAWQAELQKKWAEYEARYGPLHDKYKEAMTPLKVRIKPRSKIEYLEDTEEETEIELEKSMLIDIGLNKVPERKRKGREREKKEVRRLEQSRRKDGEPPHWITPKQLWLAPETPPEDIRFLLALYLWQEGMIELSDNHIYEIFAEYLKRFGITKSIPHFLDPLRKYYNLPQFLVYLRDHYDLPQDWRGLKKYIGKAKHEFLLERAKEYIVDDTEQVGERRVQEEKGSKRSRIPKEQLEEQSVDAAVIQLGTEGLEVSRDTIYRWIRERKVPVIQKRREKIRLTQESIEQIRQILEQKRVLKQGQEKRKNLMEYLIEGKGKCPEAAKKYIQRKRKAGKTVEDIARGEQLVIRPSQKPGADIGHEWGEQDE